MQVSPSGQRSSTSTGYTLVAIGQSVACLIAKTSAEDTQPPPQYRQ
jgi:hypothetical protein